MKWKRTLDIKLKKVLRLKNEITIILKLLLFFSFPYEKKDLKLAINWFFSDSNLWRKVVNSDRAKFTSKKGVNSQRTYQDYFSFKKEQKRKEAGRPDILQCKY